jgi:uncharacterized DUF497 family protein
VDFSRIEGFDWDDGNSRKSSDRHAVSPVEAEQIFADERVLISADERHSENQARHHALGTTPAGRVLLVTFTIRHNGTKLRIISARAANRKERALYEEET